MSAIHSHLHRPPLQLLVVRGESVNARRRCGGAVGRSRLPAITAKIPFDHLLHKAGEGPRVFPAERFGGLRSVPMQQGDVGWAEERGILDDILVRVQPDVTERNLQKLADGMRLSARNHVIVGLVLLQHGPHRHDVVLGVSPVARGVQVPKAQPLREAKLDPGDVRRNLSRHKLIAAPGTLMVEKNPVGRVEVIGFTIVPCQVIARYLRDAVGGAGMQRCLFVLGRCGSLAEHLTGSGEIEAGVRTYLAHTRQHVVRSIDVRVDGRKLVLDGIADEALGGQVVDLIRLHSSHDLVETRVALQRGGMQLDSFEDVSNAPEPVLRILQRDSADDAMDVIAFLDQELSQIGTILAGYTRNQSFSRLHVLLLLQVRLRLESMSATRIQYLEPLRTGMEKQQRHPGLLATRWTWQPCLLPALPRPGEWAISANWTVFRQPARTPPNRDRTPRGCRSGNA